MAIKGSITEHDEQAAVISWALWNEAQCPELRWLHAIPNGAKLGYKRDRYGRRYAPQAKKLIAEGMKKGVPDLCLPVPIPPYHGLYIEMKRSGGKATEDQNEWIDFLKSVGYFTDICYGSKEAIASIATYLGIDTGFQ